MDITYFLSFNRLVSKSFYRIQTRMFDTDDVVFLNIGYEEQHTRGVPRHNGRNLLDNFTLFVSVTTEDDQIGHTGPRHWRPRLRRLRIMPEAGEFCLDRGEIDRLRCGRVAGRWD